MVLHTHETKRRSIVKAITMKILEILTSGLICYFVFGEPIIYLGLPCLLEIAQLLGYFFHEQAWSRIHWGRINEECEVCHFKDFHEKRKKSGKSHD